MYPPPKACSCYWCPYTKPSYSNLIIEIARGTLIDTTFEVLRPVYYALNLNQSESDPSKPSFVRNPRFVRAVVEENGTLAE